MTSADVSVARRLSWSVRRELWENRSVVLAPLIVGGLALLGFAIALFTLPARMSAAQTLGPAELREVIEQPYLITAIVLMGVELIVAIFYCLDALYGERRDRSILFWKSLPVSDLTTVLSKASIPILVLPLVTFLATVLTQWIMLLASSLALTAAGMSVSTLWAHVSPGDIVRINFSHIVAFHGIWYAPLYGWLLLASAWATRMPFLWAALPPVAIGIVERIAFNSSHFAKALQQHFLGSLGMGETAGEGAMVMASLAPHSLGHYLISPGLWVGLAASAVFLLAAVRLRRSRAPI